MLNSRSRLTICGALLGLVAGAATLAATTPTRRELLTFRSPVALPGVTLTPGTYSFEIFNPYDGADVVLVRSTATRQPKFLGLTHRVDRRSPDDVAHLALGEARVGDPAPILAWYPSAEASGRAFIYAR